MSAFQELTSVPVHELIESVATGIARAQYQLDVTGIKIAQLMSGIDEATKIDFGKKKYSLLELGFTPTFYQFVDTVIEVKVSISMTSSSESSTKSTETESTKKQSWGKTTSMSSSVSASYSSKYQYSAEGSSLVRTKLVPVPAPAILNDRIRALIEQEAS
jgi:hypothetical protein